MTVLCGGGTSGPKTGTAAVVDYTAGLLGAIFAAYDIAWLIPVIPLVGLAPLTLNTFCGTDPPAVPTFTLTDTEALLQLQFGPAFDVAIAKVRDLILGTIWYDACQCTAGSPSPLIPPTPPAGTPITVYPRGAPIVPCVTNHAAPATVSGVQTFSFRATAILNGLVGTSYRISDTMSIASGAGCPVNYAIQETVNGSAATYNSTDVFPASGYHQFIGQVVNRNATDIHINVRGQGGTGSSNTAPLLEVFCNGADPNAVTQQPCCPPDVSTQSYLDHILEYVQLIQRQTAPFGYVTGAVHAGLTGAGLLEVSGLLGVKVLPAAVPGWAGVSAGDPDTLWLDSWLNWGNADGWTAREFFRSSPFLSLPPLAGQFTKLGYSLRDGLSVTVTELVREP